MSNNIEKAIDRCRKIITTKFNNDYSIDSADKEAIETVLQALENSISKDKVKEKIGEIDLKINNLKIEINKTLRENEEARNETEIYINEQYLERLEIELETLENTQKVLQELLEDK